MNHAVKNRIESLDWLRGLMAVAIMFYHLTYWHISPLDSASFLGRMGIYGVSVFFVLSGLSMAVVYSNFIVNKKTATIFFIRRIFRIWPLLWVCIALLIVPSLILGKEVSAMKVLLNMTTLFGFVSPESYLNVGAWSIGNEMVYYALTPILIMSYRKSRSLGNALLALSFFVGLVFAFYILDSHKLLSEQWDVYINPFNNLFFYVTGVAIYFNLKHIEIRSYFIFLLFFVSISVFMFYPVSGDQIAIAAGVSRVVFALASIMLVIAFYKFSRHSLIPKEVQYPLEQLGIATYGVYLLHPLIDSYVGYALKKIGLQEPVAIFVVVVALSVALAIVSFRVIESRIMKYGKKVTSGDGGLWMMPRLPKKSS